MIKDPKFYEWLLMSRSITKYAFYNAITSEEKDNLINAYRELKGGS
jgi:hypothetical protein